ncbi:MAG TPA: right-handed parallel beta-helix repeat-containing protein [Anaerolineae bacterium]|nr:right-handed parallel beta-helix repeat-containing protein [Anaerolineae bacterium]
MSAHRWRWLVALLTIATAAMVGSVRAAVASRLFLPILVKSFRGPLSITFGQPLAESGLHLDVGGDWDTEAVQVGNPATWVRRTGNGAALPSPDGNSAGDYYLKLRVDDAALFSASPTSRVLLQVEYWDSGSDSFSLEYDALSGGPYGDGTFKSGGRVVKTNSNQFRAATFLLCDARMANRMQDADLRLSDNGDGADSFRAVTLILQPGGALTLNVDSYGANPWDDVPDSAAIQACLDRACDGDTVTFTSGVASPGYQGYRINQTLFLIRGAARSGVTYTSTSRSNPALLRADSSLKGFMIRLYARSSGVDAGAVDNITVSYLNLDGGRSLRRCFGMDGVEDGTNDNWGSWLPECSEPGDSWCSPGSLGMDGAFAGDDPAQAFVTQPWRWSTGLKVEGLRISNTECGTALSFSGAASTLISNTIDTAGDHVHLVGCLLTDPDEPTGGWSDGITFTGPGHVVTGNLILDPSDVGIVFFGGRDTVIQNNTVSVRTGNRGAFAGIAVHPWWFGDVSGVKVLSNTVTSEGNTICGGIHAGINLGTHMWGGGCVGRPLPCAVGNSGPCVQEPTRPAGSLCTQGLNCQEWGHVAAGRSITLKDNYVAGAHINYLIEGMDLDGQLILDNNRFGAPRQTDWGASKGCDGVTWGPTNMVAHHPSLTGWTDLRIHCER